MNQSEQRKFAEGVLARDLGEGCYWAIAASLSGSDIDALIAEMSRLPPKVSGLWAEWMLRESNATRPQKDWLCLFVVGSKCAESAANAVGFASLSENAGMVQSLVNLIFDSQDPMFAYTAMRGKNITPDQRGELFNLVVRSGNKQVMLFALTDFDILTYGQRCAMHYALSVSD